MVGRGGKHSRKRTVLDREKVLQDQKLEDSAKLRESDQRETTKDSDITISSSTTWTDRMQALSSLASAILLGISILYLGHQVQEARKQTTTLNRTLKESYRPVASVLVRMSGLDTTSSVGPKVSLAGDGLELLSDFRVRNVGGSLLSYLGAVSYLTDKEIDFRRLLLSRKVDTLAVRIDSRISNMRMEPILADELLLGIGFKWKIGSIPDPRKKYYQYTLFMYFDQDNNLYDTLCLEVLQVLSIEPSLVGLTMSETYWEYTKEERAALKAYFDWSRHPNLPRFLEPQTSILEPKTG